MEGDYFIPNLILPNENKPIGIYGQRHLQYLKENRKYTYIDLLTQGKLNEYFVSIDERAEERFGVLLNQMKQSQGITEKLKADNQVEWVQKMNSIRGVVVKVINRELIYI